MWSPYLLAVICIAQTIPALQAQCVPTRIQEVCQMAPAPNAPYAVTGTINLDQMNYCGTYGKLVVRTSLSGFPRSNHTRYRGLQLYQYGDLSNGCRSLGEHYNPTNMLHGGPHDKIRHVGDFGNVPVRRDGTVAHLHRDSVATLAGLQSVRGRGMVLHEYIDDLGRGGTPESRRTGNAGPRLSCCVIGDKHP